MIKRTLYFGNPAYLSTTNEQLVVEFPMPKGVEEITKPKPTSAPIEDIGVVILDHQQITISQALMAKLLANNTALITCDNTHHPTGLMLNLDGHTLQSQRFKDQLEASEPLKKQLWQQTVIAKIQNQAAVLGLQSISHNERTELSLFNTPDKLLINLSKEVKSGDSDNTEAIAAGYYWKHLFAGMLYETSPSPSERAGVRPFTRDRYGDPPNNLLNYGYAILRAIVARSLVGSGLLPTLGIHHRNQYNAYCLADDIMEPYRPYVDKLVCEMISNPNSNNVIVSSAERPAALELTPDIKKQLLAFPAMDVTIDDQSSPLMNAVQRTTASLAKCYEGKARKILYPTLYTE